MEEIHQNEGQEAQGQFQLLLAILTAMETSM